MVRRIIYVLMLLPFLLAACTTTYDKATQVSERSDEENASGRAQPQPVAPPLTYASKPVSGGSPSEKTSGDSPAGIERVVIKNGNLTIAVSDPQLAMETIVKLADEMKGYVVSSNLYKARSPQTGAELPEVKINIRVPAERLDEAMTRIKALVGDPKRDIRSETISGQDVTSEYTDLNSRLNNLLATEKQLLTFMESAKKTEELLAVYNQLTTIREQIEVLKGRIKYIEESARLSSLNVYIQAKEAITPPTIGGWEPVGIAADALQALVNALKGLVTLLIWLVLYLAPILLIIGLPFWLLRKPIGRFFGSIFHLLVQSNTPSRPLPPAKPDEKSEE